MNKKYLSILLAVITLTTCSFWLSKSASDIKRDVSGYVEIDGLRDVKYFFPRTVKELRLRSESAQKGALGCVEKIIACPIHQQNEQTMLRMYDRAVAYIAPVLNGAFLMTLVGSAELHDDAQRCYEQLGAFWKQNVEGNVALYQAFKTYEQGNAQSEQLSEQQRYFLTTIITQAERAGVLLSEQDRARVSFLEKRITELSDKFRNNINNCCTKVIFSQDELVGMDQSFLKSYQASDGLFYLPLNYHVYSTLFERCSLENTRKKYSESFDNRNYPENEPLLQEILQCRMELAQLLGFSNYAEYVLAPMMCNTAQKVFNFEESRLLQFLKKDTKKMNKSIKTSSNDQTSTSEEKSVFSDYFALEKTLEGVLGVMEKFFNVSITKASIDDMWSSDKIEFLKIADPKTKEILGYIFLDLYERKDKYTASGFYFGTPRFKKSDGTYSPAIGTILDNFSENTPLLNEYYVQSLFRKFGYAFSYILGATDYLAQSGIFYHIDTAIAAHQDFIEVSVRVMEFLALDPDVLRQISCHYVTGQLLPESVAVHSYYMQNAQYFFHDLVTLAFNSSTQDIQSILKKYHTMCFPNDPYDSTNHWYCSDQSQVFYGCSSYCYLWGYTVGKKIFEQLKKDGLFSQKSTANFINGLFVSGASKDPQQRIKDFLGTDGESQAFYKEIGL